MPEFSFEVHGTVAGMFKVSCQLSGYFAGSVCKGLLIGISYLKQCQGSKVAEQLVYIGVQRLAVELCKVKCKFGYGTSRTQSFGICCYEKYRWSKLKVSCALTQAFPLVLCKEG